MPKRKRKKYSRPRRPFDKPRILEENGLIKKYGLKNKREIWKADAAIARIRNLAKKLITKSEDEKNSFIEKLQKKGFKVERIAEVLALDKEDWLKRRLQTLVFAKKLSNTPKQARQFIVHKHVRVGDRIINIPSYQVSLDKESDIRLDLILKTNSKDKSKMEKIEEQFLDDKENEDKEVLEVQIKEEPSQENNLEVVN